MTQSRLLPGKNPVRIPNICIAHPCVVYFSMVLIAQYVQVFRQPIIK